MLFFLFLQAALALITSPAEGQSIAGMVYITGTAAGPSFARYEIAFAYEPNPTDTWFEMQPPSAAQVAAGTLAVWDTRSIADGIYMIRLRVYSTDSQTPAEAIVHRVIVQNAAPTPALPNVPTQAPTSAPQLPSLAAPVESNTSIPAVPSVPSVPSSPAPSLDLAPFSSAFCSGIYITFGAFLILGTYAALRDRIKRPIRRWLRRVLSDIRKP